MQSSRRLGVVAGVASAVVAITNNLLHGDPQLVSVLPDFFSTVAAVGCVSIAVHLAIKRSAGSRAAGLRASIAAGLTFGVAMGIFTLMYLSNHSIWMSGFATATSAVLLAAFGAVATALHGHRDLMAPSRGF